MTRIIEDSEWALDAVALLIDKQRDIDRQIYDALAAHIRLDGLTLTVGSFGGSRLYPPQHVRRVQLTDGYASVEFRAAVEIFMEDRARYIGSLARQMVLRLAEERYLIRR